MIKRTFNHWLEETVEDITKRKLTEITFSTGQTPSGSKSGSIGTFCSNIRQKMVGRKTKSIIIIISKKKSSFRYQFLFFSF